LGNTSVASGTYAAAVGPFAVAQGYSSAALGDSANALGDRSVALGANAIANNADDVALGSGSETAAANPTASTTIDGTTYNFAGTTPTSVVSVGTPGNERQITNVAAGRLSATSTDAVNGSQLYATNQAIDAVGQVANAGWNLSANGGTPVNIKPGATVDVAQGTNIVVAQAADGSLTIATSMTPAFTSVTAGDSTLDNGGLTVNDGTNSTSYGSDGVTIANGPSVTTAGIDAGNQKITNVAAGTASSDAVNVGQLDTAVGGLQTQINNINQSGSGEFQTSADSTGSPSATGENSAAGGANATASGTDSVAVGNGSTASGDQGTALGTTATASGTGSTAIGDGAQATGDNSVALGAGSVAGDADTVSVGSAGNERKITNVAAGTAPTDAVNVSQLQASQEGGVQYDTNPDGSTNYNSVTMNPGGDGPTVIHNVASGVANTDAVNLGQVNTAIAGAVTQANNYTDQRFSELKGSLNQIGNRANAGIASAIAAASLPQPYAPNQSSLGVGMGTFRGEAGIAVGLSKISESGRFIIKANVNSDTRGDVGAGVGAGIVW
jgi:autotransporter adhesin